MQNTPHPEEQTVSLQQNREAAANCHEFKIALQCTGGYEIREAQNEFGTVTKEV